MKSRASIEVSLSLFFCLLVIELVNADDAPNSNVVHPLNVDDHKLLLECQHPDYRTYIKCLKRQKRHHWHGEHDGDRGDTKKCFDECGMEQCESTTCVHDCHKRCMKKTKETRQIITQYETTCVSDDCTEKAEKNDLPATNITTNIDINNVINNHLPKSTLGDDGEDGGTSGNGPGDGGGTAKSGGRSGNTREQGTCCGGTDGPPSTPNWPCITGTSSSIGCNTGLILVPQVQFVPQITFGLGMNSYSALHWPNHQLSGIDCSSCGNPFMRYRCDVSCYNLRGSGANQNTGGRIDGDRGNCISPHCVGGA